MPNSSTLLQFGLSFHEPHCISAGENLYSHWFMRKVHCSYRKFKHTPQVMAAPIEIWNTCRADKIRHYFSPYGFTTSGFTTLIQINYPGPKCKIEVVLRYMACGQFWNHPRQNWQFCNMYTLKCYQALINIYILYLMITLKLHDKTLSSWNHLKSANAHTYSCTYWVFEKKKLTVIRTAISARSQFFYIPYPWNSFF